MLFIYETLEIYEFANIKSKEYRPVEDDIRLSNYVVLLGLTFIKKFYNPKSNYDITEMSYYFKHTPELVSFCLRTRGAVEIDPFSQELRFEDSSIRAYSYKRVQENNYYTNRPNSYYSNGSIGYKTVFALQGKNEFAPYRKREWTSIARYQALYPDDNIMYPIPDYREDKSKCKWCGQKLPEGKKSYCSIDCRLEYGKVVFAERGALLPYLILCRDNFTCQKCHKDLAMVNEYGMKIPASRLYEIPDKDGVLRAEAEVDHITPVAEGGTDHQSNLGTKCQCCHKLKHKENPIVKSKNNVIIFKHK